MGYTSYLSGEITIHPPIPWGELRGSPYICADYTHERERTVWLRLVVETVETDEGTLTRTKAVAIRPSGADELRADGLARDLQGIVDRHGEGRTFEGLIVVRGEESPDIWRVRIIDGRAVEERPRIVWPDGTEQDAA